VGPDTILLACGWQTFRLACRGGYLNDDCLEGQQTVLKNSRKSGIAPTSTPLYGAPTIKPGIPLVAFEESPQDLKLFSAMQDQDQTSSRGMLRVSPIVTIREGFEKIASRAEVVVFGHRLGSALIQQGFSGNSNFVPVGNRRPSGLPHPHRGGRT